MERGSRNLLSAQYQVLSCPTQSDTLLVKVDLTGVLSCEDLSGPKVVTGSKLCISIKRMIHGPCDNPYQGMVIP